MLALEYRAKPRLLPASVALACAYRHAKQRAMVTVGRKGAQHVARMILCFQNTIIVTYILTGLQGTYCRKFGIESMFTIVIAENMRHNHAAGLTAVSFIEPFVSQLESNVSFCDTLRVCSPISY
jgi:hypothetical protein